jgi:uroporphyrinogen-III synthase
MPSAWHIIAETQQASGETNAPPFREYFVVAIAHSDRAVESLRMRKNLAEAKLTIVGEATQVFIDKFGIKDGEIISIAESSQTPVRATS